MGKWRTKTRVRRPVLLLLVPPFSNHVPDSPSPTSYSVIENESGSGGAEKERKKTKKDEESVYLELFTIVFLVVLWCEKKET